jgi:hypothetical protein
VQGFLGFGIRARQDFGQIALVVGINQDVALIADHPFDAIQELTNVPFPATRESTPWFSRMCSAFRTVPRLTLTRWTQLVLGWKLLAGTVIARKDALFKRFDDLKMELACAFIHFP